MNQRWETGRVEAFSDGVFAIAITLVSSRSARLNLVLLVIALCAVLVSGQEGRLSIRLSR